MDRFRSQGGRVAAVTPIHYHRALLRAHGVLPVEIWGPPRTDTSLGDAHLQAYTCSIVRAALAFFLDGGIDAVDLLVMPHGCDSLQGLASVVQSFVKPQKPVLPLYLPRGTRACDVAFLAAELRAMGDSLSAITKHSPDDAALLEAVGREEAADARSRRLLTAHLPVTRDVQGLYRLLRTREYLPAEDYLALTDGLEPDTGAAPGIPLILSGIVPEPMDVLSAISAAGGRVVADDTACCGRRAYGDGAGTDPHVRMAEAIVHGPPDPMRGSPINARLEHLGRLAGATGARGVLFYVVKYCEPELYDIPLMVKGMRDLGLQTLVLETEVGAPLEDRTTGRIEAFMEMMA
ncbi:MAG: 2-hydroxyacyl-CoA dehydratase family protein [Pseudomonadota bacterium]